MTTKATPTASLSGQGPAGRSAAGIMLPSDVAYETAEAPTEPLALLEPSSAPRRLERFAGQAQDALRAARSVAVLVGPEADRCHLAAQLVELVEEIGCPVACLSNASVCPCARADRRSAVQPARTENLALLSRSGILVDDVSAGRGPCPRATVCMRSGRRTTFEKTDLTP
ncbi:hypothetical protein AB0M05_19540 [Streptomyces violaceusniger]|uniref:hypothetical protein n=1 Tax=Streptomyces violaceusniger TaxID=68280 RepID=UPI0034413037